MPFPRSLYFGILKILFKFFPAASIPATSMSGPLHALARYAIPIGGTGSAAWPFQRRDWRRLGTSDRPTYPR